MRLNVQTHSAHCLLRSLPRGLPGTRDGLLTHVEPLQVVQHSVEEEEQHDHLELSQRGTHAKVLPGDVQGPWGHLGGIGPQHHLGGGQ